MTALRLVTSNDTFESEAQRMFPRGSLRDAARYLHHERGFDRQHTLCVLEAHWHGLTTLQIAYVDAVLRDHRPLIGAIS